MSTQIKHTPGPLCACGVINTVIETGIGCYDENEIAQCPLCKAAPAMYIELQNIVEGLTDEITRIIEGNKPDTARLDYLANKAGQAIAQAEGTK